MSRGTARRTWLQSSLSCCRCTAHPCGYVHTWCACKGALMRMAACHVLAYCYATSIASLYAHGPRPLGDTQRLRTQGWAEAVLGRRGDDAPAVAAAALYVLEVTRANAQWAAWAERDTKYVRWGCKQHGRLLMPWALQQECISAACRHNCWPRCGRGQWHARGSVVKLRS